MIRQIATALLAVFLLSPASANAVEAQPRTLIVMDGSGSMWGQIEGTPKLEIARQTLTKVLSGLPDDLELGLMAYGHREKGNCGDIELIVPPAAGTASDISRAAGAMRFLGKTPLSAAVQMAAEELRYVEDPATVVLVTDGVETCEADPCALASALENAGIDLTVHVIGFGLTGAEGAQVSCIAENTGGRYFEAGNGDALADALSDAVTSEVPNLEAKVPDLPAPEQALHYPGAEMMPDIAFMPTGYTFGDPVDRPREVDFPVDGTPEQCRAACDVDALCGSWSYSPRGTNYVDHAGCAVYGTRTEFNAWAYPTGDGRFSGMKPGVIGLLRPYVPIGSTDVEATVMVRDAVIPGAEFAVDWTGPAGEDDWVDVVPRGHVLLSGEISYFDVNDTIDRQSEMRGTGTLTAPAQAGEYDLRYVFGRRFDRQVLVVVPLTVGGPAGIAATPTVATEDVADANAPNDGVPALVKATFRADTGEMPLAITWSATPVPGQDLPPDAWAMHEAVIGPVIERFLPGRYDVVGDGGDSVFAGVVDITVGGSNDFTIPRSAELSPAGEDQADAERHTCQGVAPCRIEDAGGLSFTLPAGWSSDIPVLYETAGGAVAEAPSVSFFGPSDAPVLVLNPIRWAADNGTCTDSRAGPLCILGEPASDSLAALAVILPSLDYQRPAAETLGSQFGGEAFRSAGGADPMTALVPQWSPP